MKNSNLHNPRSLALYASISITRTNLLGTSTLAYFGRRVSDEEKKFKALTHFLLRVDQTKTRTLHYMNNLSLKQEKNY